MNLTVMCDKVGVEFGDVTLTGVNAIDLAKAADKDGTLEELLAAIAFEKGKDWFKQATDEVME